MEAQVAPWKVRLSRGYGDPPGLQWWHDKAEPERFGEYVLPRRVVARFEDDALPHVVWLDLLLEAGRYRVKTLTVEAKDGTVTSDTLRAVPVKDLVTKATLAAPHRAKVEGGKLTLGPRQSPLAVTAHQVERWRGAAPDDDTLERVALIYRLAYAAHDNPTQAVVDYFERPRSTASRWIRMARERGYLRPAPAERRAG